MSDHSRTFIPAPTNLLALLLGGSAIIITWLNATTRLDSPRPTAPPTRVDLPAADQLISIHARMWEDPFARIEEAQSKGKEYTNSKHAYPGPFYQIFENLLREFSEQAEKDRRTVDFCVMPILLRGGPWAEDQEERMRTTYGVFAALGAKGYEMVYPRRMTYAQVSFRASLAPATRNSKDMSLLVPVKLFRRRAFHDQEAKLSDRVLVFWLNQSILGSRPMTALDQILRELLWGEFDADPSSEAIQYLTSGATPETGRVRLRLAFVGPHSSDLLYKMASELKMPATPALRDSALDMRRVFTLAEMQQKGSEKPVRTIAPFASLPDVAFYSPRATVRFEAVPELEMGAAELASAFQEKVGAKLVHAIGDDGMLTQLLARELVHRQAWPDVRHTNRHIVLVTERDTLYGRMLPEMFAQAVEDNLNQARPAGELLHTFTYLAGIDGHLPDRKSTNRLENKGAASGSAYRGEAVATTPANELPQGRSQRDYLRRLERQILELHARLRREGDGQITAIGVVGSDIYDKLLVLRALRPHFPDCVFFTTDLDARLGAVEEIPFTRNMIIASHYGLELNPRLQLDVMRFRDSYQTSTYVATLLALGDKSLKPPKVDERWLQDPWKISAATMSEGLEPLTFEIGRGGPYQLQQSRHFNPASRHVHPPGGYEQSFQTSLWWWFFMALAVVMIALVALLISESIRKRAFSPFKHASTAIRHWSRLLRPMPAEENEATNSWRQERKQVIAGTGFLLGVLLLACLSLAIAYDQGQLHGEPFSWDEGISIWPSVILQIATAMLAWAGVARTYSVEREHACDWKARAQQNAIATNPQLAIGWPDVQRSILLPFILLGLAYWLGFVLFRRPIPPARGLWAGWATWLADHFATLSFTFLALGCVLLLQRCARRIADLAMDDAADHPRDAHAIVGLVAHDTQKATEAVWWPFVVGALLLAARSNIFDDFHLPNQFVALVVALLGGVWLAGFRVRREAQRFRRDVVRILREKMLEPGRLAANAVHRIRSSLEYIRDCSEGAFATGAARALVLAPLLVLIVLFPAKWSDLLRLFGGLGL